MKNVLEEKSATRLFISHQVISQMPETEVKEVLVKFSCLKPISNTVRLTIKDSFNNE
jgi:hypothetical protein